MATLQDQSEDALIDRKYPEKARVNKRLARMSACAIHDCEAEATVVASLPAFPLNWEHPVCQQHLKQILDPHTKLQYLDDDTIAVFAGKEHLVAD
jgi:hypothetical protein